MKKKTILVAAIAVMLVAALVVGGTLAYFTDTKTADNTFTMGNVAITLDETNANPNAPTGSGRVTENTYNVYPGQTVTKDPTVHNTGRNAAYIRATVTVSNWATLSKELYPNVALADTLKELVGSFGEGWSVVGAAADNSGAVTFTLKYDRQLAASADTAPMFQQVTVPAGLENDNASSFKTMTVQAQAIQADGFTTWDAAFAAFDK